MWNSGLRQEAINKIVGLNLIGLMYGCRVAINGMLAQGYGFVYNMYGFGSTGMLRTGMSIYGSTKRAVNYFTETMVKELATAGKDWIGKSRHGHYRSRFRTISRSSGRI